MRIKILNRSQDAFTLVELLVVLAIIAILASLLLPALSHAQSSARIAACKNNLGQCSIALHLYTETYDAYPQPFRYLKSTEPGFPIVRWTDLLEEFLSVNPKPTDGWSDWGSDDAKVLLCPVFPERSRMLPFEYTPVPVPEYGYNEIGAGSGRINGDVPGFGSTFGPDENGVVRKLVRTFEVVAPANLIILGDRFCRYRSPQQDSSLEIGGSWGMNPTDGIEITPGGISYQSFLTSPKAVKMHRTAFTRLFCDGHIETESFRKPFIPTDDYMRRWNLDNKPHREWNE